ncbi:MAG TPA: efflux RND transporter periplasmic adaptor subunit [Lacipirellulaceae bacterium]
MSLATNFAVGAEPLVVESALLRLTQQVDVPARAQGVISTIHVAEGDSVEQGTLLAQMDDTEARLLEGRAAIELQLNKEKVNNDVAIRSAQRALVFNKSEFERLERVRRDTPGSISASELEERRFRAEQAELDLEKAQHERRQDELSADLKAKELELSQYSIDVRKILAPINGVVVEVLRQPGEWVEPGEKVLRIVRIDRLRVEGMVHARDLPPDLRGAPVTITMELPGKGETTFEGKIVFVSPEISPVNGQVRVWAEVDNKDGLLKPGLRPRMTIVPATVDQSAGAAARLDRQSAQRRARE